MLDAVVKKHHFSEWKEQTKSKSLISKGEIEGQAVTLVEPDNFMNRSGASVAAFITSPKKAQQLVVIYDDLDLALGNIKVSYNRSSGGHRGLESIIRAIKTQEFVRIRVGISPATPSGKLKKPLSGEAVEKHIIGGFKKAELDTLKNVSKKVLSALEMIVAEGHERAMGEFN
jgi:PTH1 family peptidyl-tRNA hydrolase